MGNDKSLEIYEKLGEENKQLLAGFEKSMAKLKDKTRKDHVSNVELLVMDYLLDREPDPVSAREGFSHLNGFMNYYIQHCAWSTPANIKTTAASIKKFYKYLLEEGEISEEDYEDCVDNIKEHLEEWQDDCEDFNSGSEDDVEDLLNRFLDKETYEWMMEAMFGNRDAAFGKAKKTSSGARNKAGNKLLYTMKVYPKGQGRNVYRILQISGSESLDTLCETIMDSFEFFDPHLYEFSLTNRMYDHANYQSHTEYPGQPSTKTTIGALGLAEKQQFLLHYDFGDDWEFVIKVQKIEKSDHAPLPMIITKKGHIRQY